jgi:hypothetical protein
MQNSALEIVAPRTEDHEVVYRGIFSSPGQKDAEVTFRLLHPLNPTDRNSLFQGVLIGASVLVVCKANKVWQL